MLQVFKFILFLIVVIALLHADAKIIFPGQLIGSSLQCVVNEYGTIGTCIKQSECKVTKNSNQCGNMLVCCPSEDLIPTPGNYQQSVTVKISTNIGYKKCENRYLSLPFNEDDLIFGATVVGGTPADPGEFPYMAAIGWTNAEGSVDWNCGGFLVEENFVVTAAHCTQRLGVAPSVVRLNTTVVNGPRNKTEEIPISRIIVHPKYVERLDYNDIAIMELATKVNIWPICLWPNNTIDRGVVTAVGYGHTSYGGPLSNKLLKVALIRTENDECKEHYKPNDKISSGLQQSQLCAGDPQGQKDTCQGDSGGPLLITKSFDFEKTPVPYAIGVTSFGQYCAGAAPSIYTRISSYVPWIESIVWPNTT